MYILGISAFYHDSAACLIKNGTILAAAQEERFTRIKHDSSFPSSAIEYCVAEAGISPADIENVVFYEKPFLKFERLLETYLAFAPKGFRSFLKAMPLWIKDKLFQKRSIVTELNCLFGKDINWEKKLLFSEHHLSHAASAFYPSPFEESAILTLDGVGEWCTTSMAIGRKGKLDIINEIHFPHSLGLLYSAFTYYAGFKVNSGEYKLMGLAPYGEPVYAELIKEKLVHIAKDGTFKLNMRFFDFATGLTMTNDRFNKLFGGPPRRPESELTQREMDLAASVQAVTEEIIIELAKSIKKNTGMDNLCLAGGVALNCVANGILIKENIFDKIWIQPAAGDAGGALGAALAAWHIHYGRQRVNLTGRDGMSGSYLGPSFSASQVGAALTASGAVFSELPEDELISKVADALARDCAVGWMQGRMEFGPRALGNRSIIADPRSPSTQKQLNLKVKYRESFRPFAPSILQEDLADWFELGVDSPYMLAVAEVCQSKRVQDQDEQESLFGIEKLNVPRSSIPAVTHVDFSARIQTVHADTNAKYHALITQFKRLTGCPVLVNTSFNVRGEPIVCSPIDAFNCFMGTDLDVLVIDNFLLYKTEQPENLLRSYKDKYDLD